MPTESLKKLFVNQIGKSCQGPLAAKEKEKVLKGNRMQRA
jgi:hypothetical protein